MGEPRPDLQVTPDIRLVKRLGKGGMGSVWLAKHARLDAEVVVKFLEDRYADDPAIRARFQREVAAAAQVRSPHVVQTFDHGVTDDGMPSIVMELLDGEDLAAVVKRQKQLQVSEVAHVLDGLVAALTKAHEKGIVHRDIKPGNVFLCSGGKTWHVKLLDFGIAKMTEHQDLTMTGQMLGTPSYMSPEQFEGSRHLDHRADVWALGILVYHCLVGHTPFRGQTMVQVTAAVLAHSYVPPTVARPDLPAGLDAFFAKACARRVDERYLSVKKLLEGFEEAITTPARNPTTEKLVGQSAPPSGPKVTVTVPHHSPPLGVQVPVAGTSAPVIGTPPDPPFDTTLRPSTTMGGPSAMGSRGLLVAGFVLALALGIIAVRLVGRGASAEPANNAATATATEPPPEATAGVPVGAGITTAAPHVPAPADEGPPEAPTGTLIGASPMPTTTTIPTTSASAAPKKKRKPVRPGSGKPADDDVGF